MSRRSHLAILVLVLAGCGSEQSADSARIDIEIVEEMRVGGIDGPIESTFGSVSAVAPAPDGTFYVADRDGPIVRKYDDQGQHLIDIGRNGQGPGEYSSVDGLGVTSDGELMLYDGRSARLSTFAPDGVFQSSYQVTNGLGGFRGFVYSRDGSAYVRVFPETGFVESPDGLPSDWARLGSEGEVQRLVSVPLDEREGPRYVVSGHGGYYRPFVTMNLSALGPDGSFYTVRNDVYRVTHTFPDGRETIIVRDESPIRVSSEETREWEARSESFARRAPERRSDYFPIPEVKPYIRELVVDLEGRLWVSRYTEAAFMEYSDRERADRAEKGQASYEWRDLLRWDVFSPDDEYLGSVTFPFKTSFMTAEGPMVWGIHGGDFNEAYIVRWRMLLRAH